MLETQATHSVVAADAVAGISAALAATAALSAASRCSVEVRESGRFIVALLVRFDGVTLKCRRPERKGCEPAVGGKGTLEGVPDSGVQVQRPSALMNALVKPQVPAVP